MTRPLAPLAAEGLKLAAAIAVPLAMVPVLQRPLIALLLCLVAVMAFIAWLSPAIPLGLTGMAAWIVPIFGVQPPPNSIVLGFALWVSMGVVFALRRERAVPPFVSSAWAPIVLGILLLGLMLVRLGSSASPFVGQQKLGLFVLGGLVFAVAGVVVARDPRDLEIFFLLVGAVVTLASVILVYQLATGLEPVLPDRYTIAGAENPIELGQQAAVGLLICAWLVVARGGYIRIAAVAAMPFMAVALIASGSRGPLMGLVLGVVVMAALLRREGLVRINPAPLVVALAAIGAVAFAVAPGSAATRLAGLLTGAGGGQESSGRGELWDIAWDQFAQHPLLGLGTGGFDAVAPPDNNGYPHNLFLEGASELGVLGLLVTVAIVGVGAHAVWRLYTGVAERRPGPASLVAGYFAAATVFAMFSGDFGLNTAFWLSLGLVAGVAARDGATPAVERAVAR